jgi:uracil-DNA glycosylase
MISADPDIAAEIRACRRCAEEFALTATRHDPRPVTWFRPAARLLIAGQAPGARVHESGIPFDDRSGDRLRDWLGLTREIFYDRDMIGIVPMAFCFPGYSPDGSDLPPPPRCARIWREAVLATMERLSLTVVIGGYAQGWHLGPDAARAGVTKTVADWRRWWPDIVPLPHPSWRNNAFLRRNPWFETELIPALRDRVREVLTQSPAA